MVQVSQIPARARPSPLAVAARFSALLAAACAGNGHELAPRYSGDPADYTWQLPDGWPTPTVPADNPMSPAKVELGRRLFYDVRLSGNAISGCSACHRQEFGFADARNRSIGTTGEPHPRNSPSVANVGYFRVFTWTDPVTPDLEHQALVPMFGDRPVELGLKGMETQLLDRLRAEPLYRELFPLSFPGSGDPFTVSNVTRALAAFQRSMVTGTAPYDRELRGERGAMSASALRGQQLFFSSALKCSECHWGPLFTSASSFNPDGTAHPVFANNGLYNLDGAGAYPADNRGLFDRTGKAEDMGKFRVPSLRNLTFTFPYMHDGSVGSLEDVVDNYARGGRLIASGPLAGDGSRSPFKDARLQGFTLTAQEKLDLVAFLRSLSDSALVKEARFSNPWALK
ncbi:MAG: di-heme enzyme [Gemmatimonadaceae bacterium]|nr:di-heme enzyme [Gemmatimonadaceae bacterium]